MSRTDRVRTGASAHHTASCVRRSDDARKQHISYLWSEWSREYGETTKQPLAGTLPTVSKMQYIASSLDSRLQRYKEAREKPNLFVFFRAGVLQAKS